MWGLFIASVGGYQRLAEETSAHTSSANIFAYRIVGTNLALSDEARVEWHSKGPGPGRPELIE